MIESASAGPFVGREREMRELAAALDDIYDDHGRLVMLAGGPGIGKTRTAEELASTASKRGAEIYWGRCHEEGGVPAYWPWVQVFRSWMAGRDDEEMTAAMGQDIKYIAEIVPELSQHTTSVVESSGAPDPDTVRFRLFDAITSFLKRTSRAKKLMIVLDDLHWAVLSELSVGAE